MKLRNKTRLIILNTDKERRTHNVIRIKQNMTMYFWIIPHDCKRRKLS